MSQQRLTVRGLTAGYNDAVAVRELSLEVGAGEVVAVLGANGAGKTTTLRTLSGLLRPMSGGIELDGQDVTGLSAQARAGRGLVLMSDRRGIFHSLTVAEHFKVGPRGEHLDADAAYELFPALLKRKHQRAGLLSGGEQQMLGLSRALARKPQLLMLDEFSLGLAPVIVQQLLPVVRRYASESGAGVILVEQHVRLALEIADRGYVLAHGRLALHRDAAVLRADRRLVEASYLGEAADPEILAADRPLETNGVTRVS